VYQTFQEHRDLCPSRGAASVRGLGHDSERLVPAALVDDGYVLAGICDALVHRFANFCLHDNEALARYLVSDFVSHFGAFKSQAGLGGLVYRRLDSVEASGDPASSYSETVKAGDLTVRLTWSDLGKPFCFALPPDKSATGKHHMPSLFVGCESATVSVNGRTLPGQPVPWEIAGRTITTAMLAFSETWIRA
jgi:hypothetical protein